MTDLTRRGAAVFQAIIAAVSADFKVGDIAVSRLKGPFEAYVVGRLELRSDGEGFRFDYLDHDRTLEAALEKAVKLRPAGGSVWPFLE